MSVLRSLVNSTPEPFATLSRYCSHKTWSVHLANVPNLQTYHSTNALERVAKLMSTAQQNDVDPMFASQNLVLAKCASNMLIASRGCVLLYFVALVTKDCWMTSVFASTIQTAAQHGAKDSSLASARQSYRTVPTATKAKTVSQDIALGISAVRKIRRGREVRFYLL